MSTNLEVMWYDKICEVRTVVNSEGIGYATRFATRESIDETRLRPYQTGGRTLSVFACKHHLYVKKFNYVILIHITILTSTALYRSLKLI